MPPSLRSPRTIAAAILVAGGLVFLVERLIVTDVEAIEALVEEVGEAADARDFDALRERLSADYADDEGRDREAVLARVRRETRSVDVRKIAAVAQEIQVDGPKALAKARVRFIALGRPWRIEVALALQEEDGDWRISSARVTGWE